MTSESALQGLKVLDLSRVLAGPYCSQILADLGADVIKVESPEGDETRTWTPPSVENFSAYYLAANRNKKIIRADFKNPNDLRSVQSLAKNADILVENFRVGTLKKFKLDYESLQSQNSRLIYCSITGFGQTGPRAKEPGYDLAVQALSGLMSITGSDQNHPTKVGVAVSDLATALFACIGILAAVHERSRSGKGQSIDMSLLDSQIALLTNVAMNFLCSSKIPEPMGNSHPSIVPYQSFKTQDGRHLIIAIGNDHQFKAFSENLKQNWHSDKRFTHNEDRVVHRKEIAELIQKEIEKSSLDVWLKKFKDAGFPFAPVQNLSEVAADPQVSFRNIFRNLENSKIPSIQNPIHLRRTPISDYLKPVELHLSDADWNSR